MVASRHHFLTELHELLRPEVYFEIGVQYGDSLRLATHSKWAIGVDPSPLLTATGNQVIYAMRSDDYFNQEPVTEPVDLAFIDGDHHYEQAVRDFYNVQRRCQLDGIIVFDDVLPYTQEVGGREMVPGHWAGDVWRAEPVIRELQPGLTLVFVDVAPTGLLLVWGLDPEFDPGPLTLPMSPEPVPDHVIDRAYALDPGAALALVSNRGVR